MNSPNVNKFCDWLVQETNLTEDQMPFVKDSIHKFINENLFTINAEAKYPSGSGKYEQAKTELVNTVLEQLSKIILVESNGIGKLRVNIKIWRE